MKRLATLFAYSRLPGYVLIAASCLPAAESGTIRLCAEPNNLPMSNRRLEGFENRIGALIAASLKMEPQWIFWAQRRGYVRSTITERRCDILLGVPQDTERVLTTRSYYRSAYSIVARQESNVRSLEDPALEHLRIGIHLSGEGYTPPAQVLARRGLQSRLSGYMLFGEMDDDRPASRPIKALERGEIDVAVIWGPFAGYFTKDNTSLRISNIVHSQTFPDLPFVFAISMAVHPSNPQLRDRLNHILTTRSRQIRAILRMYRVPLVDSVPAAESGATAQ